MKKLEKDHLIADAKRKKGCLLIISGFIMFGTLIMSIVICKEQGFGSANSSSVLRGTLLEVAVLCGVLVYLIVIRPAKIIKEDHFFILRQHVDHKYYDEHDEVPADYYLVLSGNRRAKVSVSKSLYNRVDIGHPFYVVYKEKNTKKPYLMYDAMEYELGDSLLLRLKDS